MPLERQRVQDLEARCIEEQPPACTAGCPIHLDVRGMTDRLRTGDMAGGFAIVARFLPFPGILSRICDHPCELVCRREEAGESVRINDLERACVDHGYKASALPRLQRAQKRRKVAVIGAGLSGMTAAQDLALKGHEVVVFEAERHALPRIRAWKRPPLPEILIETDLALATAAAVTVRIATAVGRGLDIAPDRLLTDYDAVFLAAGAKASIVLAGEFGVSRAQDGRPEIDPLTFGTSHPKLFAGGSLRYTPAVYSPITSTYDGRCAALSIDRLFQGASLVANRDGQGPYPTRLFTRTEGYPPLPALPAANPARGYSAAEAQAEAARCFPCHCLECIKVCDFLAHHGSYPKRYIREIYNNDGIVKGARKANRLVNSCSLCGLCEAVCPEHLPMGDFCLEARQSMVGQGKMQPSFHDFALQDMAFSTGEDCSLARHQPGFTKSAALFFPGCQLAGSSPDHVAAVYAHLCDRLDGGVGLLLGCCGAPARWSGREALFRDTLETLAGQWRSLGRPDVITACSSCFSLLRTHLPDMTVRSLWTTLERTGLPAGVGLPHRTAPQGAVLAIHDPCTTRHEPDVRASVRALARLKGLAVTEIGDPELTSCCGFGGLMSFVSPRVADLTLDRRAAASSDDFLTYCAMCRDNFARRGKRALHLLDLLFETGGDPASRPDPGFSSRQENRARLRQSLLASLWGEAPEPSTDAQPAVHLADDVRDLAERRQILMTDVRAVIVHAEESGDRFLDGDSGHFLACLRPRTVTFWVEYAPCDDGYQVFGLYSHRMTVGPEGRP